MCSSSARREPRSGQGKWQRRTQAVRWAALLAIGLILAGCRTTSQPDQPTTQPAAMADVEGKITVFVSVLPQAYFVERVAGERVAIEVLVGPGQSPTTYEPSARQMKALAKARAFFRVGVPFEDSLMPKIAGAFEDLEIVDTRQGITLRQMEGHACTHESHDGHTHEHEHAAGDDPHIWLSPKLAKVQAQTICDALCRLDPAYAETYRQNLATFHADLDALDARIAAALAPVKGRELFVFHPAYGYFADAYGLKQVAVEIEGKEPDAKGLVELIQRAKAAGAKVIFVQPQFSVSTAKTIAQQIGGVVTPLDPLARDYIKNLDAKAEEIRRVLTGE